MSAISSSATANGARLRDVAISAMATAAAVALPTQESEARLRFQASADEAAANAHRMDAVAAADNTLKLTVSSQSMGARMSAEVHE